MVKFKTKEEAIRYCFTQIKPSIIGMSNYNKYRLIRNRYDKDPESVKENAITSMFAFFNIDSECVYYERIKTYLMLDTVRGFYKIGKSKNPKVREKTLQAEIPCVEIIHIINDDVERELHFIFKEKRLRGEWFKLSKKDVIFIKKTVNRASLVKEDILGVDKINKVLNEEDFYKYLKSKIDVDMVKRGLKTHMLRNIKDSGNYFISSSTYGNINKTAEGVKGKTLSAPNLKRTCEKLDIDYKIVYQIEI